MAAIPIITTPFVQRADGQWCLVLEKPMPVECGHRFDEGVGYRVYVKFVDSENTNIMGTVTARAFAKAISNGTPPADVARLAATMIEQADTVDKLNGAWLNTRRYDRPLIEQHEGSGHA